MRPAKFSISFTMGNILVHLAIATLRGYDNYLRFLFSKSRVLITIVYFVSMGWLFHFMHVLIF